MRTRTCCGTSSDENHTEACHEPCNDVIRHLEQLVLALDRGWELDVQQQLAIENIGRQNPGAPA